eukprot:TRINITY_DN15592_c0_g1_i1.p1 TRINITY_DN15592_c0_g1~~TRINITY_DN15592_c0_g1_i1.p1  ORF type:complete len:277 (+),score=76.09 TRINITY_DN15592_c0_g1_i1:177-1007(+)
MCIRDRFTNVSHGKFAKKGDLQKAFGTGDEEEVCKIILEKGEIQISSDERKLTLERLFTEIAAIVAEKCINTDTRLPVTATYVERAMKELNFNIKATQAAKQQALVVISLLREILPIQRARMRVKISIRDAAALTELIDSGLLVSVEGQSEASVIGLIDPGSFRQVDDAVRLANGEVEIMSLAVVEDIDGVITDREETREQAAVNTSVAAPKGAEPEQALKGAKGLTCKNCDVGFDSRDEHREHFKSEWHRFNLKLKSQGNPPISVEEFEFEKMNL